MENMKFMLANKNLMKEKLDNWKCDKCGSMNDPKIITKKVDDKPLEMHIICEECGNTIVIAGLEP